MSSLCVNILLEWQTDEVPRRVDRILWIDPSGVDAVLIKLETGVLSMPEGFNPKTLGVGETLPKWHKVADLEAALLASELCVLEQDPYAALLLPEESISPEHRKRRNAAWELIEPLIERGGEISLFRKYGGVYSPLFARRQGKPSGLFTGTYAVIGKGDRPKMRSCRSFINAVARAKNVR